MIRETLMLGVASLATLHLATPDVDALRLHALVPTRLAASSWDAPFSDLLLRFARSRADWGAELAPQIAAVRSAGYALPDRPLGPGARFEDPVRASLDALRFIDLELPRSHSVEWGGYVRKLETERGARYTYDHPRETTVRSNGDHVRIRVRPDLAALWFHTHSFCSDCPRGPSTRRTHGSRGDLAVSEKLGVPGVLLEITTDEVFYFTGREHETLKLTREAS